MSFVSAVICVVAAVSFEFGKSESGIDALLRRYYDSIKGPMGIFFNEWDSFYEIFTKISSDKKIVEFIFNSDYEISLTAAPSNETAQMIFDKDADIDLPPSLAYPGSVLFVNHPLEKALWSLRGFKMSLFLLHCYCPELPAYLKQFWENKIYNVLGLCVEKETIRLFTINPYDGRNCNSFKIIAVGIWNKTYSTVTEEMIRRKIDTPENLQGCSVHASFFDRPPGVIKGPVYSGWEVDLLREVLKTINGHVTAVAHVEKSDGSFFLREELNQKADIVGGMLYNPFLRVEEVGVDCGLTVKMSWATPKYKTIHLTDYRFISLALPLEMFLWIFFAYFLMVQLFYAMSLLELSGSWRKRIQFFNIFSLILNQPSHLPKLRSSSARFQFAVWSFFALIISCSYQAGLKTQMTLGRSDIVLKSMYDLVNSDLKIVCKISYYYSHLKGLISLTPDFEPLKERIVYLKDEADVKEVLTHVSKHQDMALLEKIEVLEHALSFLDEDVQSNIKVHYGISERVVTPFVIHKKTYLGKYLEDTCAHFVEGGIIQQIKYKYNWKARLRRTSKESSSATPLTLVNLAPGFSLLFVGLYFSFITFLMERFYFRLKAKKKRLAFPTIVVCFISLTLFPMSLRLLKQTKVHPHGNFLFDMSTHTVTNQTWWYEFLSN